MTRRKQDARTKGADDVILAVDMGGSKFIAGLVNGGGKILAAEKHLWSESRGQEKGGLDAGVLVADVKAAVHALLAAHGAYKPVCMGATIPGLADPEKGLWVEASFSGIRNLPFAAVMESEFGLPVKVDNDVRACALAEKRFGCCKDASDFLWITVSNGIGGCVFLDGKPYRGASGNAGEIGHVIVEEGSAARPCRAGHSGCAEMHASGPALAKNYLESGGAQSIAGKSPCAKSIAALARAGDGAAIAAYEAEGRYLGRAIGAAVNLLGVEKVVLGGGVSLDFDLFRASLEKTLAGHVYRAANPRVSVEASPLGYYAALLGAAALSSAVGPDQSAG
ncbi:MAG: ROK family protein [Treponema sp.]|jgi:glucokinase|nr:ROK family protein [Treponema sp.]